MKLGGIAAVLSAAVVAGKAVFDVSRADAVVLHPPGAQGSFDARCVKCGKCIEACPYKALHVAPLSDGVYAGQPTLDVREQACRLCPDFPCIDACPTGALEPVADRADVRMGVAVINEDLCLSYKGMRCEVCYRACPLIDEAIYINYGKLEGDDIHAMFAPVIVKDKCTGCGLCVERCVVSEPEVAIKVVPCEARDRGSEGKR